MEVYICCYVKWELEATGLNLSVSALHLMSIDRWMVYARAVVRSRVLLMIIGVFAVFVGSVL